MTALLAVSLVLVVAGLLAAGGRWRRGAAVGLALINLALPFALGQGHPFLRFIVALMAFWGAVRVVDLSREQPPRPWHVRLWHVFAIFDTRAISRVPARFDGRRFGLGALHLVIGALGLGAVLLASWLGYAHTAARWGGGIMFVYGMAVGLGELIPACYLLGGIAVPAVQATPIAARSLRDFWGQRWNRVVSSWLRSTFFRPLARRGRGGAGVMAAFLVSALLHGYVAAAGGGAAVAIPMTAFFLLQGVLMLVERALHVERWPPGQARAWFLVAMIASVPLFLEPMLAIVVPGVG